MTVRELFAAGTLLSLVSVFGGSAGIVACSSGSSELLDDEKELTSVGALDVGVNEDELEGLTTADPAQAASLLTVTRTVGCRTRTLEPAHPTVVHVTLDDCSGRFGRHTVSGELTDTFSLNPDGSLHLDSVSSDLTIDGRPFSRTVSSDITFAGDTRSAARHSEETGTKGDGDSVVRSSDDVIVTDDTTHCRTVNGTGSALIAGTRTITSTTTNLETCEASAGGELCPTGAITLVNEAKAKTLDATFNGTSEATIEITRPRGEKTRFWDLDCTAR